MDGRLNNGLRIELAGSVENAPRLEPKEVWLRKCGPMDAIPWLFIGEAEARPHNNPGSCGSRRVNDNSRFYVDCKDFMVCSKQLKHNDRAWMILVMFLCLLLIVAMIC